VSTSNATEASSALELELRRGVLVLAILSQLRDAQYGYSLKQALGERGLNIEEGTLYPLLRRLETQGLLHSKWRTDEGRPRRYYQINAEGEKTLAALKTNWQILVDAMARLLNP